MSAGRALRAAALAVLPLAVGAVLIILATGGFAWHWGPVRITARDIRNPVAATVLSAMVAWALSSQEERRRAAPAALAWIRAERGPLRLFRDSPARRAALIAGTACIAVVLLGFLEGTFIAGGADSYGYVSQADLWARGQLVVPQPFARDMTWPNAAATLVPYGYTLRNPTTASADLVAVYSPGLPMLMALFKLAAGPKGVFFVVPLLGGLAVWATYAMGRRAAGPAAGAAAAVLLAASPSFLFEMTSPTSDVPATAWWACALTLLLIDGQLAALGAGVAVSMAVLTRPNLALVVVIPGVFLAGRAVHNAAGDARRRLLLFATGLLPGYLGVATLNTYLYGSPLASGYGSVDYLYRWTNLQANAARYPRWLLQTQTPIVLLAIVAPFLCWRARRDARLQLAWTTAAMWWCFVAAVICSYLLYRVFNEWGYVRFLLPAYPPLLVLTVVSLAYLLAPLRRLGRLVPDFAAAAAVALVTWHGVSYAVEGRLLAFWKDEARYATAGHWVSAHLPERAVLLSGQHSGSARYYSGRLTVRYDLIPPSALDIVVTDLRRLGYAPYLLLDDFEEADFRRRFNGQSALAPLDWWPVAMLQGRLVKIYDLSVRGTAAPPQ